MSIVLKSWNGVIPLFVCVLVVSVAGQEKIRTLVESDVPVVERLLPNDAVIDLVSAEDDAPLDRGRMSIRPWVKHLTDDAELVAVVDVSETAAQLTAGQGTSPSGTSIVTRIAGTVHEVLKSSAETEVSAGQPIEAYIARGQVSIGRVLVRRHVVAGDAPLLPTPTRYLLFLRRWRTAEYSFWHVPLMVTGGKIRYPWSYTYPHNKRNALDGKRLEEIAAMVRRVADQGKK